MPSSAGETNTVTAAPSSMMGIQTTTLPPTSLAPSIAPPVVCGCPTCLAQAVSLVTAVNETTTSTTCGEEVMILQDTEGYNESIACEMIIERYPETCGMDCDSLVCPVEVTAIDPSWFCGCESCDESILDSITDDTITCRDRIDYVVSQGVEQLEACSLIGSQFPDICSWCNPDVCASLPLDTITTEEEYFCDCRACTPSALATLTDGNTTCAARIQFLLDQGTNEMDACITVSDQFPTECGFCNPKDCPFIEGLIESDAPSDVSSFAPTMPTSDDEPVDPTSAPSLESTLDNSRGNATDTSGSSMVVEATRTTTVFLFVVGLMVL